ncbi:putative sodium:proton antiporter [Paratrimastix pyriformis]|uniref:Sodium:proton antiporter n=1 Tax=Paratrimastix pyriformis TaxID=342808 RepID=A0ABQ8U5Q8_9EUKA|nr:putative sodium:proton antiporter [Paratrimastix pyriformis]
MMATVSCDFLVIVLALFTSVRGFEVTLPTSYPYGLPFSGTVVLNPDVNISRPFFITAIDAKSGAVLIDRFQINTTRVNSTRPLLEHDLPPITLHYSGTYTIDFIVEPTNDIAHAEVFSFPGLLSLFPPVVAIIMAVWTRQATVALFSAMFIGACILMSYNPFVGFFASVEKWGVEAIASGSTIITFTFLLGGLLALMAKSGGSRGLARVIERFATTRRRALLGCFALSCLSSVLRRLRVHPDGGQLDERHHGAGLDQQGKGLPLGSDYDSLTGIRVRCGAVRCGAVRCGAVRCGAVRCGAVRCGAVRCGAVVNLPPPPRFISSRVLSVRWGTQLSNVIDCMAAPLASVFLFSSWIGFEVGLLNDQFQRLGLALEGYVAFINTIPYCFYSLMMIAYQVLSVLMARDFGPLLKAERRAQLEHRIRGKDAQLLEDPSMAPVPGKPQRWYNAVLPIITVLGCVGGGMIYDGYKNLTEQRETIAYEIKAALSRGETTLAGQLQTTLAGLTVNVQNIVAKSDSPKAMLWGTLLASVLLIALVLMQKILDLQETMDAFGTGLKSMVPMWLILLLAWGLARVCGSLHTAAFFVGLVGSSLPACLVPIIVFFLSAAVAFAVGSAWATMSIFYPLVIPLALQQERFCPTCDTPPVFLASIAAVLCGSVFGINSSPISDTTLLSSMATSCHFADHVKTQVPVTALVAGISAIFYLVAGFEVINAWYLDLIGVVFLALFLLIVGGTSDFSKPTALETPKWKRALGRLRCVWWCFPGKVKHDGEDSRGPTPAPEAQELIPLTGGAERLSGLEAGQVDSTHGFQSQGQGPNSPPVEPAPALLFPASGASSSADDAPLVVPTAATAAGVGAGDGDGAYTSIEESRFPGWDEFIVSENIPVKKLT